MALILESSMEKLVNERISGNVARVGGTVDQLLRYDPHRISDVEDINLLDDFFGAVKIHGVRDVRRLAALVKRRLRQESLRLFLGKRIPLDRKTVILDLHEAHRHEDMRARYDCTISSNLIEHSPNPLFLLLNLYFITKPGGYQFHAIPHHRHTYDAFRAPTSVEHLIEDFERMTDVTDITHHDDYIQSAIEKHGWMRMLSPSWMNRSLSWRWASTTLG